MKTETPKGCGTSIEGQTSRYGIALTEGAVWNVNDGAVPVGEFRMSTNPMKNEGVCGEPSKVHHYKWAYYCKRCASSLGYLW